MRGSKAKAMRKFVNLLVSLKHPGATNTLVHREVKILGKPFETKIISSYDNTSPKRLYKDAKRIAKRENTTAALAYLVHLLFNKPNEEVPTPV